MCSTLALAILERERERDFLDNKMFLLAPKKDLRVANWTRVKIDGGVKSSKVISKTLESPEL